MKRFADEHLFLAPSQIPGAGSGLFTASEIPKGTLIGNYTGKVYTKFNDVPNDGTYVFEVNQRYYIDAMDELECPIRYVNDADGLVRIRGVLNNARFIVNTRKHEVGLYAIRNIQPGSEILGAYGSDYWQTLKKDMKQSLLQANEKRLEEFFSQSQQE